MFFVCMANTPGEGEIIALNGLLPVPAVTCRRQPESGDADHQKACVATSIPTIAEFPSRPIPFVLASPPSAPLKLFLQHPAFLTAL